MKVDIFKTDWGWMGIGATPRGVTTIILPKPNRKAVQCELASCLRSPSPLPSPSRGEGKEKAVAAQYLEAARVAIEAYLSGTQRTFDLPLDLDGQPTFRKKVWGVLKTIPYGRVRSYGWVARKIGKPLAARAVGGACGANPLPLIVPCHRVVAGNGSLGGFSGGLPVKKRLLRLEGVLLQK